MAWRRDETRLDSSSFTAYAYTEAELEVGATKCTYRHLGGITSPYYFEATADSDLWWEESGNRYYYASGSDTFNGYGDLELCDKNDYLTRLASDRTVYLGVTTSMMGASADAWLTYTVPHLPNAPASITATRVSDNQVTVSWTAPTRSYDAMCLEVSIDGGSWSEFTQLWNASTSTTYGQASADHSYRFRARAYYQSAYSDYTLPTAAVAMTPSAPQSISVAASGGTNVAVSLTNNSPVATSLEYQTSTDGGSTWSASTTVSGSPVTSFSTSVSGTALIRVRNKNATGVSDWLVSDPITTICPPAPPTLRTPSGSVYDMAQGDIEFSWLHNSLDGSTQTAYELRYAINGGAWTTLSGTTAQSRTVSIGTFSAGNAVTWQVRTKGADANYSDWSQTGAFNVYTAPTLSITSPGATITGMPISLTATYSDMAGFTCQAATVSLQKDGRTLYSESATISGTSITSSLDVSEFLPTNGETYTVVVTARSSSSLQTTANASFLVDFTEPVEGSLQVQNEPETGYVSLLATFGNSASDVEYSGNTNTQYESTEGYVRSLTVDGKSEVQSGSLVSIEGVSVGDGTITTTLRGLPQGKGDELQVNGTSASKLDRTYYDTISAVGTVNTSGATWYAALTTTNQATFRRNWTSADDFNADRGTTGTEFAYCTKTEKISSTGKGIFVARTWNALYAYCTAADAQELGITTSDFAALVGAGVIARNKTVTETLSDISPIEIGSAFTVATDLDSTFELTTWDGSADAESVSVSRVNADGTLTPLLTDGQSGAGIVDKYAPLNTDYQYAVTTKADTQAVKTVYVTNRIDSLYWFAYWGENVAKAKWNPDNGGIQVTRPQKTRVYYAGRRDPVSYDGHAVALNETPSWMFIGKDEVDTFVKLIEDGGRGVYKSCDGWVYHADFDLTLTPSYTAIGYYGGASLGITRIAGERL